MLVSQFNIIISWNLIGCVVILSWFSLIIPKLSQQLLHLRWNINQRCATDFVAWRVSQIDGQSVQQSERRARSDVSETPLHKANSESTVLLYNLNIVKCRASVISGSWGVMSHYSQKIHGYWKKFPLKCSVPHLNFRSRLNTMNPVYTLYVVSGVWGECQWCGWKVDFFDVYKMFESEFVV